MVSGEDFSEDFAGGLRDLLRWAAVGYATEEEYTELLETAREAARKLDDEEGYTPIISGQREEWRDYIAFITFASQINEYLLREAVYEHIIADQAKTDEIRELTHELNAERCLDFLFKAGIVDSGVKGEIGQVKELRNSFVHGIDDRLFHKPKQSYESQVDRAERSLERLVELAILLDE